MAYPRQDPALKIRAVCGGVVEKVKKKILQEAIRKRVTISYLVGEILTQWAEGVEDDVVGVREYLLWQREQKEKEVRAPHYIKGGPLGKEKREEKILHKER